MLTLEWEPGCNFLNKMSLCGRNLWQSATAVTILTKTLHLPYSLLQPTLLSMVQERFLFGWSLSSQGASRRTEGVTYTWTQLELKIECHKHIQVQSMGFSKEFLDLAKEEGPDMPEDTWGFTGGIANWSKYHGKDGVQGTHGKLGSDNGVLSNLIY